jgi:trimeric autotransporter adhesin
VNVNGTCFIGNIRGVTTQNANALPVVIDGAGQLGTVSSSQRFKHDIKPMSKASEAILALKPVTFHYKSDSTNIPQFGLIAEEVEKANPDLVVRDENGEIYTVRYDAVNAMLLNEFLKEHRKVEQLEKQVAALTAGLQKVTAQVEMTRTAPRMVVGNQ